MCMNRLKGQGTFSNRLSIRAAEPGEVGIENPSKLSLPINFLILMTCDRISGMAMGIGTIIELRLEPDGLSAQIACPSNLHPAPGQYLAASSPSSTDPLPVVLYPIGKTGDDLMVAAPLAADWHAGMNLSLRGPLGRGFNMPVSARRVALTAFDKPPSRLLPLADQALRQGASVAVYAGRTPAGLPPEVEVLPVDLLPEAPTWADFMALDVDAASLPGLRSLLGLKPYQRPPCTIQALIAAPMPCTGLAECGVCAVATRSGWMLACSDGPVFDFNELEGT